MSSPIPYFTSAVLTMREKSPKVALMWILCTVKVFKSSITPLQKLTEMVSMLKQSMMLTEPLIVSYYVSLFHFVPTFEFKLAVYLHVSSINCLGAKVTQRVTESEMLS